MAKPPLPKYKIAAGYLAWWIVWMGVQTYVLTQGGFDLQIALRDSIATYATLAIAGYIINSSMHYFNPSQRNSLYVSTWCIALAVLSVFVQKWLIAKFVMDPGYLEFVQRTALLRGVFDWLAITFVAVLTWSWVYVKDQMENEKRKEDLERLAREAELSNLRLQLQPHFLFNSLNSISALIGSQPEQARTMIQQLSDFLRGTVRKDDRQLVTLREELEHLQLYLEIEKVRFGHRLATDIQADDAAINLKLPSLLLQPIVENAIKFGLYDTVGEITITVHARVENNQLMMRITNPFDPATAQPRKGTGFGLNSVQRRLYLLYAQSNLLSTQQDGPLFITTLTIPQYT
jgi:two-component system, LytTR family, sensor kinase